MNNEEKEKNKKDENKEKEIEIEYKTGYVEGYMGPMRSKKTTLMISRVTQLADMGEKCIIINSKKDTRTKKLEVISTHNSGISGISNKVKCLKTQFLRDIDISEYTVVGVDEADKYEDLVDTVVKWSTLMGKTVIWSGLDGDIECRPIGQTLQLIPHSDKCEKMRAYCTECKRLGQGYVEAPHTGWIGDKDEAPKEGEFSIGFDKFLSLCKKHYYQNKKCRLSVIPVKVEPCQLVVSTSLDTS